jgi:transposase-like protein
VRRGRAFWKQLVVEVDRGEAVADVARRHRVQPRTLSWWRWKLRSDERVEARFLPVVVSTPAASVVSSESEIELRIRDVTIRVRTDADVAYIASLIEAIRG